MIKSWDPGRGEHLTESGLMKPPRQNKRALSPAGMFGEKAPLRFEAQKSRPNAPLAPVRSAPAYFIWKWGVYVGL
jgi:hypothetical protein